jgi:hypothetical protein
MMGPLLTIRGREPADDLKMLEDLEIEGVNLPGGR